MVLTYGRVLSNALLGVWIIKTNIFSLNFEVQIENWLVDPSFVSENIEISEDCNTLNGLCYCYCLLELISSEDTRRKPNNFRFRVKTTMKIIFIYLLSLGMLMMINGKQD